MNAIYVNHLNIIEDFKKGRIYNPIPLLDIDKTKTELNSFFILWIQDKLPLHFNKNYVYNVEDEVYVNNEVITFLMKNDVIDITTIMLLFEQYKLPKLNVYNMLLYMVKLHSSNKNNEVFVKYLTDLLLPDETTQITILKKNCDMYDSRFFTENATLKFATDSKMGNSYKIKFLFDFVKMTLKEIYALNLFEIYEKDSNLMSHGQIVIHKINGGLKIMFDARKEQDKNNPKFLVYGDNEYTTINLKRKYNITNYCICE